MFLLFRRLFWNLFLPILVLLSAVALSSSFWATRQLRQAIQDQTENQLSRLALLWQPYVEPLLSESLPKTAQEACNRFKSVTGCRATLIAASGIVLADSDEDPVVMDNHATRPEIIEAREKGTGTAVRFSHTVRDPMMYYARRIMQGGSMLGYVRVACPLTHIEKAVSSLQRSATRMTLWVLLLAAAIALFVSRQVAHPLREMADAAEAIAEGDAHRRVPRYNVEELQRLSSAFNSMVTRLQLAMKSTTEHATQLAAVLESMAEGVIATDNEQRVVNMNAAAASLLGLPKSDYHGALLGEVVRSVEILEVARDTISQRSEKRREVVFRDANGNEHFVEIRGHPWVDRDQRWFGCVLVLHDATRLWQLERIRRDFVANVSHELKTPITSIKGAAETLLDGAADDSDARSRFLQIIARHADRLNAIITDLLLLARVEQEGEMQPLARQFVPIGRLLQESVQICRSRALEKNIEIEVSCPPALTARVAPDLLEQAVINLLDNAIKYSDPGKPVRVMAKAIDGDLDISVEDHGCGIAPEHLPRIFERFYRVDKARSRAVGGTGLGLAIVKHIVQLHHGTVSVQSKEGHGSTFTIKIPLQVETTRRPV